MSDVSASLYAFDAPYLAQFGRVCGVDEAGRGPLCGPVSVAAVILDETRPIPGLNDSKKLSEQKREALYPLIVERAVSWKVVLVDAATIDERNILGATLLGMQQAVAGLAVRPALALVDGNRPPQLESVPVQCLVRGDGCSAAIAAASVLAKVTRDRYMEELDRQYPQYRLAKHKGYPTKEHYALLAQYGLQPFYRRSFLKNWDGLPKQDSIR